MKRRVDRVRRRDRRGVRRPDILCLHSRPWSNGMTSTSREKRAPRAVPLRWKLLRKKVNWSVRQTQPRKYSRRRIARALHLHIAPIMPEHAKPRDRACDRRGPRLGRAIALDLAKRGWRIGVHHSTSTAEAESLVEEIERLGSKAVALPADLTSEDQLRGLVQSCAEKLGPPTCLDQQRRAVRMGFDRYARLGWLAGRARRQSPRADFPHPGIRADAAEGRVRMRDQHDRSARLAPHP